MAAILLRPLQAKDIAELVRMTRDTGFFRADEVEVSREVLTDASLKGEGSGYSVYVAANGRPVAGYVCFGPTPMTLGTWDLYWIVVDARQQRQGIGRRLMQLAEEEVLQKGGRLIVVETSSQELYVPTRQFYISLGYRMISCIPDYYDAGDSKVTFIKNLRPAEVAAR